MLLFRKIGKHSATESTRPARLLIVGGITQRKSYEPCFVRSYYPTTEKKNIVSRRNWTGIITLRPRRIWNYYPATVISWLRRKRRYKRRRIVSLLVRIKNLQPFFVFRLVSWNLFFSFSFFPFFNNDHFYSLLKGLLFTKRSMDVLVDRIELSI